MKALLLALALAGCPGPTFVVQQFNGPQQPREAIAVLRVNGGDKVRLLYLDEQDVATPIVEDGRLHIEMLPKRHTVIVSDAAAPNEKYPLAFDAQAGKVYRVIFSPATPHVYEVDRDKDVAVKDVSVGGEQQLP
jgi:hypothetical protein